MKAYIINLERSTDRKDYIESVMKDFPWIDYEFFKAVDGKKVLEAGCRTEGLYFDVEKAKEHYNTQITPGEVGCTLSHQLCYRKFLANDSLDYVCILEDDVIIREDFEKLIPSIEKHLSQDTPIVLLLSGMYWRMPLSSKKLDDKHSIVKTADALLASSYLINRCAAEKMLDNNLYIKADDWMYFKLRGVHVEAVKPHIVDQDWSGKFATNIFEERYFLKKDPLKFLKIHTHGGIRRLFKLIGMYEEA